MTPLDFPLPADENIAPAVLSGLRSRGDVRSVWDKALVGRPDADVLDTVDALRASVVAVQPPFIAIADRQQSTVRVRVRMTPPW